MKVLNYQITISRDLSVDASCNGKKSQTGKINFEKSKKLLDIYVNLIDENKVESEKGFKDFGSMLFDCLMAEPIHGHFREQAWRVMREDVEMNTFIRIHLIFDHDIDPYLMSIPWEYLYYEIEDSFLCTHKKISLSYWMNNWIDFEEQKDSEKYFKDDSVLLVSNIPEDLEDIYIKPIRSTICGIQRIKFKELSNPSFAEFHENLITFRPKILHYISHGSVFNDQTKLATVNNNCTSIWQDAVSISNLFQGWRPKVVILHSCKSGHISNFKSITELMVRKCVPAIIAMRYDLEQGLGWSFVEEFYASISENIPLDFAVQNCRIKFCIRNETFNHNSRDFGIPILWLHPKSEKCIFKTVNDINDKDIAKEINTADFKFRHYTGLGYKLGDIPESIKNDSQYYLNQLREDVGFVRLSHISPEERDGIRLDRVYVPLPTNLSLNIEIKNEKVSKWWVENVGSNDSSSDIFNLWNSEIKIQNLDNSVIGVIKEQIDKIISNDLSGGFLISNERPLVLAPLWMDQIIFGYTRLEAFDIVSSCDRVVILGGPGTGKSTFARYLSLYFLGPQLIPPLKENLVDNDARWPHGLFLPLYINLRRFSLSEFFPKFRDINSEDLLEYIKHIYFKQNEKFFTTLIDYLNQGKGILILDGLDEIAVEITTSEERIVQQIKNLISSINLRFESSRIVITSRPHAYNRWKLDGFNIISLSPLEREQKFKLAKNIYLQSKKVKDENVAELLARKLIVALEEVPKGLSDRPLFLTLQAILFYRNWMENDAATRLPSKTGTLIYENIQLLLGRWTEPRLGEKTFIEELGCNVDQLYEKLENIAFKGHKEQATPRNDFSDTGRENIKLEIILVELFELGSVGFSVNPIKLVSFITETTGILESPAPRIYRFSHRMFQEFLAASYITKRMPVNYVKEIIEEQFVMWREVCLLLGDIWADNNNYNDLWALIDVLITPMDGVDNSSKSWHSIWLAGRLFFDQILYKNNKENYKKNISDRLREKIIELISTPKALTPAERVELGKILCSLQDTRKGVGLRVDGLPDIKWIKIPAGPFFIGTSKEKMKLIKEKDWADGWDFSREMEGHEYVLREYFISKFPITKTQYMAFVSDKDGYSNEKWWSPNGLKWKLKDPNEFFSIRGFDGNLPQTNISWYEAVAFCNWLSERFGMSIRIPTEVEWEKAARGSNERIFPWGDEFDFDFCNAGDTGVRCPSPVGCFNFENGPWGSDGPLDMVGNTWEWCSTICQDTSGKEFKYPYTLDERENNNPDDQHMPVVRGGCYSNKRFLVRTSYRGRDRTIVRYPYQGFRIVADVLIID